VHSTQLPPFHGLCVTNEERRGEGGTRREKPVRRGVCLKWRDRPDNNNATSNCLARSCTQKGPSRKEEETVDPILALWETPGRYPMVRGSVEHLTQLCNGLPSYSKVQLNRNTHKVFVFYNNFCSPSSTFANSPLGSTTSFSRSSYLTIDDQSVSLFWYQTTIWDPRPIFFSPHGYYLKPFAVFFSLGRPPGREDWSVICSDDTGPCQRCHSLVQVPQNLIPYFTVSFETGFPFCRLLRLAGIRWRYSNPPPRGWLMSFSRPSVSLCSPGTDRIENVSSIIACSLVAGEHLVHKAVHWSWLLFCRLFYTAVVWQWMYSHITFIQRNKFNRRIWVCLCSFRPLLTTFTRLRHWDVCWHQTSVCSS
jgi:hypothetical protein